VKSHEMRQSPAPLGFLLLETLSRVERPTPSKIRPDRNGEARRLDSVLHPRAAHTAYFAMRQATKERSRSKDARPILTGERT
jgi:hypothetical protein